MRCLQIALITALTAVHAVGAGCAGRDVDIDDGEGPPKEEPAPNVPDLICPGDPSCSATLATDPLLAGAAKRVVTPLGFEIANAAYLQNDRPGYCAPEAPVQGAEPRCGELRDEHVDDCGRDGICRTDEGWVAADVDGSERDDIETDWWFDCGMDRVCPDNVAEPLDVRSNGFDDDGDGAIDDGEYTAPDPGEGDGEFQGLWIAGYGNNRPAMGVKDDLWVRAIVFRQGDSTLAIVTIDAVGYFFDEQERMRAKLEALRPGEVDAMFVQSSHTHEAPDTMGQWGYVSPRTGLQRGHGRSDAYMESLQDEGAQAVADALDALAPARIKVGVVHTGVDGLVRDSRDPNLFNDAVTGVSVENAEDDSVIATLASWGNHPESLDSRNNFISSDYVGAVRDALEAGLPETDDFPLHAARGGVGIYLQGAVGGLMGPNGFVITGRDGTQYESDFKTFTRTDAYGEIIAEHALAAIDGGEVLASTPLAFSTKRYKAPVHNQAFHVGLFNGWFDRALFDFDENQPINEDNLPTLETAVGVVRIGEIAFITAPGELFPETFVGYDGANSFGRDVVDVDNENPPDMAQAPSEAPLKELLGADYPILLGLCQDETGYLVPPFDFKLAEGGPYIDEPPGDHYEETNSIGPLAVPLYLENAKLLFDFEAGRGE